MLISCNEKLMASQIEGKLRRDGARRMKRILQASLLPLFAGAMLLLAACGDDGCPTCVAGVDPGNLIDPLSLGDGSGYPGAVWTAAPSPEALGWSSQRLADLTDYAQTLRSDGFMVVDRGVVVWEYRNTRRNLIVQSCRKSFLSALYGIYHEQGLIDLDIHEIPPSGGAPGHEHFDLRMLAR